MSDPIVHSVAQIGFGTGTNELYDKARPSYQPFALAHIKSALPRSSSSNVVELGSGTGIFTRALLADPEWQNSIAELKAFEPSEGMRDVFSKTVQDPRVTVHDGTFDHFGVEDDWADIIVVAQAFHWCPDYNAAMVEFARALKPDGIAALIWNLDDRDGAGWAAKLRATLEANEKGTPQFRLGLWRQTFDTPAYRKFFEPPEEKVWSYHLLGSHEIIKNRALSASYIAILPDDEKAKLAEEISAIIDEGEGRVWIDEKEGIFEYPYKTFVEILKLKQQ
ncbi:S-adenosyl-L-methionine-dependent methyltransferase [Rickenella mellea]|uniref:S-adenosyl-L-methionine-dependent methyltransferase n=1 Tax=Rickenella mellea TaxID=50990 RepID=A0A4Y7QAR7_9AGAM|nr:S-adenosyl-L-methionine-dependent methyltransferase [Rickenella mellea]